jgi:hypothetical protein
MFWALMTGTIYPVGFLWQGGHMYDLNALIAPPPSGLHIRVGYSISDRGDIATWSKLAIGVTGNESNSLMSRSGQAAAVRESVKMSWSTCRA